MIIMITYHYSSVVRTINTIDITYYVYDTIIYYAMLYYALLYWHSAAQHSTAQCSAVQLQGTASLQLLRSAVQCSAVQHSQVYTYDLRTRTPI